MTGLSLPQPRLSRDFACEVVYDKPKNCEESWEANRSLPDPERDEGNGTRTVENSCIAPR